MYQLPLAAQKTNDIYEKFQWQKVVQIPSMPTDKANKWIINNREVTHFGNLSYLGIHDRIELKEAAAKAVMQFGMQFPSSRSFTYNPMFDEFEGYLTDIFGAPTLATAQTTMADLGAMSLLFGSNDVAIMDAMAHATMQMAALIPKASGLVIDRIKHNDLDHLESKIKYYQNLGKNRIWYVADSVYSMYGNVAPVQDLIRLTEQYDNFFLYLDEAHGTSWSGPNGAGYSFKFMPPMHEKIIIVTSLAKGFGVGGGALICPNEKIRTWMKRTALNSVFCVQTPVPLIAAGIASAKIHLSNEIYQLQDKLMLNIDSFVDQTRKHNIQLENYDRTPVFYIPVGTQEEGIWLNYRLQELGYYGNLGIYPAVPEKKTGVRISINATHSFEEIVGFVEALEKSISEIKNNAVDTTALRDREKWLNLKTA
jgi:7-keto-8-aminopelargonate synthetase-like enzyme